MMMGRLLTAAAALALVLGCGGPVKESKKGKKAMKEMKNEARKSVEDARQFWEGVNKEDIMQVEEGFTKYRNAEGDASYLLKGEELDKFMEEAHAANELFRKLCSDVYVKTMSEASIKFLKGDAAGALAAFNRVPERLLQYRTIDVWSNLAKYKFVVKEQGLWNDAVKKMYQEATELGRSGDYDGIYRKSLDWTKAMSKEWKHHYLPLHEKYKADDPEKAEHIKMLPLHTLMFVLIGAVEAELKDMEPERAEEHLSSVLQIGAMQQIVGYINRRKEHLKKASDN